MTRLFATACVVLVMLIGNAQAQSGVTLLPDRLREGDGITRTVKLEARVDAGASVSISVSYSSDPASGNVDFIPKFVVQDNGGDDKDSQKGKIRLVLPKDFDQIGVYTIAVEGTNRSIVKLVHERNNSSYFRQFAEWLVGAAGGGQRNGLDPKSAAERIEAAIKTSSQDKLAIRTVLLPAVGETIKSASLSVRITSAVMPAWSPQGNDLAVSAWRNEKWVIAAYKIEQTGDGIELWQWNSGKGKSNDFSPAWSPNGDAIAFVRLSEDRKSDIWILELDQDLHPKSESQFTSFGNVQAVLGWDKDLGLLFETKSGTRQVWGLKTGVENASPTPLPDSYSSTKGSAPLRQTVIYAEEFKSPPPLSVVYEINSNKRRTLILGATCWYRWPTVSRDEKLLALESECRR